MTAVTPLVVDVPGLGRLAIVADDDEARQLGRRARGKVWSPRELELLKGWPQEDARKVAECKALFRGILIPSQHTAAATVVPEQLVSSSTPSARRKRYNDRGHGPVPVSAYAVARQGQK